MIQILEYTNKFHSAVVDLVTSIQQKEFGVAITYEDQPDLQNIHGFFQKNNGNFWVAIYDGKVVGTIGLIGLGKFGVIRKMFVHKDYRGSEFGIAKQLLNNLENWCSKHSMPKIYLGTVSILKAAHRFYEKNHYQQITEEQLPKTFPKMAVDTMFYCKKLINLF
jgi:N-acetylglutamate synthase-like GNAT family acetyltransferase